MIQSNIQTNPGAGIRIYVRIAPHVDNYCFKYSEHRIFSFGGFFKGCLSEGLEMTHAQLPHPDAGFSVQVVGVRPMVGWLSVHLGGIQNR